MFTAYKISSFRISSLLIAFKISMYYITNSGKIQAVTNNYRTENIKNKTEGDGYTLGPVLNHSLVVKEHFFRFTSLTA